MPFRIGRGGSPLGYGASRGGSGKIRLLIALAIGLFALGSYFFSGQENPITGETQRVGLSPDQEVALGLSSAPELIQQMGGEVPEGTPAADLVDRVGGELLAANPDLAKGPYQFEFYLLDDPQTVNAFALPGGPVFITTALLERMQNTAQLAGVLGHEVGHVVHRHSAQRMAKANLFQGLAGAAVIGASEDYRGGQMAAVIASTVGDVTLKSYGRQDELESDDAGLGYMAGAGYDPAAMIEVMRILKESSGGGGGPEWTQTHPNPDSRIERIEAYLKEHRDDLARMDLGDGEPIRVARDGPG